MKQTSINLLETVVHRFEHWRLTRKKRERIPEVLWQSVAPLMNQYSHNEIATALKVNHEQLKEHVHPLLSHAQQTSTTFVEYPLPVAISSAGHCVLEFASKSGSMVKISGLSARDIHPLISLLMGT